MLALDKDKCFGKTFALQAAGIAKCAGNGHPTFHLQKNRRHIFAANGLIDSLYATDEPLGLSKQKANDIENVNPHVGKNEFLELPEKGLILENGKTGAEINMRPERFANRPRIQDLF